MSDMVQYGSWSVDEAKKAIKELDKKETQAALFYKLEVGQNVVRFVPPTPEMKSPFLISHQHYLRVPGADRPVVFACPMKLAGRHCPACAYAQKLQNSGNQADRKQAWEFMPRMRVFANVIDREDEASGPKVLGFGKMIYESLIKLRMDEYTGGDYTHPENGFDIVIDRTGMGKQDTSYSVRAARNSSNLGDMSWIRDQHDLTRFATPPSEAELREMIAQATGGGVEFGGPPQTQAQPAIQPRKTISEELGDDDLPW